MCTSAWFITFDEKTLLASTDISQPRVLNSPLLPCGINKITITIYRESWDVIGVTGGIYNTILMFVLH